LLYNSRKKSPYDFISQRDWPSRLVWAKENDGSFIFVVSPDSSRPESEGVIRGKNPGAMRIKRKNHKEIVVTYVIHPDAGGQIPRFVMNLGLGSSLATTTRIQEHFQALRGLDEWDADDGRAVGEIMCVKTKAEKHHEKGESKQGARMRELFRKHKGLEEIAEK